MDYAACHVVYVDKRAQEERFVKKDGLASSTLTTSNDGASDYPGVHEDLAEPEEVQMNIQAILSVFNGGMSHNVLESTAFSSSGRKQKHPLGCHLSAVRRADKEQCGFLLLARPAWPNLQSSTSPSAPTLSQLWSYSRFTWTLTSKVMIFGELLVSLRLLPLRHNVKMCHWPANQTICTALHFFSISLQRSPSKTYPN